MIKRTSPSVLIRDVVDKMTNIAGSVMPAEYKHIPVAIIPVKIARATTMIMGLFLNIDASELEFVDELISIRGNISEI